MLDVTTSIAGPYCAQILAALGANVVKVERPDTGDDGRAWGPPFWNGEGSSSSGVGLAICRAMIEAQGGSIHVESPPGGGARFVFTLPARHE